MVFLCIYLQSESIQTRCSVQHVQEVVHTYSQQSRTPLVYVPNKTPQTPPGSRSSKRTPFHPRNDLVNLSVDIVRQHLGLPTTTAGGGYSSKRLLAKVYGGPAILARSFSLVGISGFSVIDRGDQLNLQGRYLIGGGDF